MADEPSYPEDAAVGTPPNAGGDAAGQPGGQAEDKRSDRRRKKPLVSGGVAFGIGSAALVAALLYANRSKRNKQND